MRCTHKFQSNQPGMEIITHLQKTFPPPKNTYLNLYKQQNYGQCITYSMLSEPIFKLKLQNQQTLYFKADPQPEF